MSRGVAGNDERAVDAWRSITDGFGGATKARESYLPYSLMNDVGIGQDAFGHYGEENVRWLNKVEEKYGQIGVFYKLVACGFKISSEWVVSKA
ncbi:hypothetical protein DL764_009000 [Monosporascus ibericus]|uniref:Uncharacterized protein n=1 Tax=Monosporascus ibericus TaxID=155417 RepID=A0A4Q4SZ84_9PEZI|nr:hypothetical protein DL764_009000 [Monosporascus ibericus]